MTQPPDARVDELRQQLKSLGYLDAGVDRFVLGAASGRRGPMGTAIRTSVRVGVLGGALLGPAAALGLGARLPGLVSGPRDAVVLALYLAVVFCAAAALVAFLVTAGFAAFARAGADRFAARAQRASRAAAWIVTIATLAYLTLWWRNANAGFGWSAPAWTSFALAVAVTISLLLGHAARIATLAVCAAGGAGAELPAVSSRSWRVVAAGGGVAVCAAGGAGAELPAVSSRSWRVVAAGGMLAFVGAAALLVMTAPTEEAAAPDHPAFTVRSRGKRVTLVAIDGFDRNTYLRMRD